MSSLATTLSPAAERNGRAAVLLDGEGDEELLGRFLGDEEAASEAAFRALVDRHGPMVLGVCRHVLGQAHDAEDAFQATFLSLARSAASIRDRRVLARWLYEVAYRIAVRARVRSAQRRTREKEAAEMSGVGFVREADPAWDELRPVLHEEVNRLPEKYRTAVVLCYLQGRTNEEAAAVLQWPVGTVKGRLSRAREMLRSRLTRRGLALAAAFLMARLSDNAVFAEVVPAPLADAATRHALAASRGTVEGLSPRVLELADGASREATTPFWLRPVRLGPVGVLAVAALALLLTTALTRGQGTGGGKSLIGSGASLLGGLLSPHGQPTGGCQGAR
jgi:RNA polymerase sigma factor (sigma-70 family)